MSADDAGPSQHVEPLDVDAVRTVQVGIALWVVALAAALIGRDWLDEQGHTWWIWCCVAGVVLGLVGLLVTTRRRRRIVATRAAAQRS